MSTILAIDTSSAHGSIALVIDGATKSEHNLDAPDGFAHVLFPAIETVLRDAGTPLSAIHCFAVTTGPGAFTGLRVGLAAAKGLAEANAKPCAALSTLRVIASVGTASLRAVILDARREQVYAAVYDSTLRLVSPETITPLLEWRVPEDIEFIAGSELHAAIRSLVPQAALISPPSRLAVALARCAELDRAVWTDPVTVDANYVRAPDAETAWRDRELGRPA